MKNEREKTKQNEQPFLVFFKYFYTPWDNRNGWLGVKREITYLLLFLLSSLALDLRQTGRDLHF